MGMKGVGALGHTHTVGRGRGLCFLFSYLFFFFLSLSLVVIVRGQMRKVSPHPRRREFSLRVVMMTGIHQGPRTGEHCPLPFSFSSGPLLSRLSSSSGELAGVWTCRSLLPGERGLLAER